MIRPIRATFLGVSSHQFLRIGGHSLPYQPTNPYESSHQFLILGEAIRPNVLFNRSI